LSFLSERVKQPINSQLKDKVFELRIVGEDGEAVCLADFRNELVDVKPNSNGNPGAFMHIEIPSSLIGTILSNVYDPFSILFTYRVKFKLLEDLKLRPEQESELYIQAFESLVPVKEQLKARKATWIVLCVEASKGV
jgi:hypothetical protein